MRGGPKKPTEDSDFVDETAKKHNLSEEKKAKLKAFADADRTLNPLKQSGLKTHQDKQQDFLKKAEEADPGTFNEVYKGNMKKSWDQFTNSFENAETPKDENEAFARLFEIIFQMLALLFSPASNLLASGGELAKGSFTQWLNEKKADKQLEKFNNPETQEKLLAGFEKQRDKTQAEIDELKQKQEETESKITQDRLEKEINYKNAKLDVINEAIRNTSEHLKERQEKTYPEKIQSLEVDIEALKQKGEKIADEFNELSSEDKQGMKGQKLHDQLTENVSRIERKEAQIKELKADIETINETGLAVRAEEKNLNKEKEELNLKLAKVENDIKNLNEANINENKDQNKPLAKLEEQQIKFKQQLSDIDEKLNKFYDEQKDLLDTRKRQVEEQAKNVKNDALGGEGKEGPLSQAEDQKHKKLEEKKQKLESYLKNIQNKQDKLTPSSVGDEKSVTLAKAPDQQEPILEQKTARKEQKQKAEEQQQQEQLRLEQEEQLRLQEEQEQQRELEQKQAQAQEEKAAEPEKKQNQELKQEEERDSDEERELEEEQVQELKQEKEPEPDNEEEEAAELEEEQDPELKQDAEEDNALSAEEEPEDERTLNASADTDVPSEELKAGMSSPSMSPLSDTKEDKKVEEKTAEKKDSQSMLAGLSTGDREHKDPELKESSSDTKGLSSKMGMSPSSSSGASAGNDKAEKSMSSSPTNSLSSGGGSNGMSGLKPSKNNDEGENRDKNKEKKSAKSGKTEEGKTADKDPNNQLFEAMKQVVKTKFSSLGGGNQDEKKDNEEEGPKKEKSEKENKGDKKQGVELGMGGGQGGPEQGLDPGQQAQVEQFDSLLTKNLRGIISHVEGISGGMSKDAAEGAKQMEQIFRGIESNIKVAGGLAGGADKKGKGMEGAGKGLGGMGGDDKKVKEMSGGEEVGAEGEMTEGLGEDMATDSANPSPVDKGDMEDISSDNERRKAKAVAKIAVTAACQAATAGAGGPACKMLGKMAGKMAGELMDKMEEMKKGGPATKMGDVLKALVEGVDGASPPEAKEGEKIGQEAIKPVTPMFSNQQGSDPSLKDKAHSAPDQKSTSKNEPTEHKPSAQPSGPQPFMKK